MEKSKSDLFIICGERSGDLHGSHIVKYLLKKNPSLRIHCWGGKLMKEAGAFLLENYSSYSMIGFIEVIKNINLLTKKIKLCQSQILHYKPKIILLIDFPGFNLKIAKFSKKNGFIVHYFIPPKTWAWKESRANILSKNIDKIYSILPFEIPFYKKYNCNISYVGNPLYRYIKNTKSINNFSNIISLLPGSRKSELRYSIPIFIELIKSLKKFKFLICAINSVDYKLYDDFKNLKNAEVIYEETYKTILKSELAIVMSGTASLEIAYLKKPQIVVYKTSFLNYLIAKSLVNIKFISLVNLILNKKTINELIQSDFNSKKLITEIKETLKISNQKKIIEGYENMIKKIGKKDAIKETSENLLKSL